MKCLCINTYGGSLLLGAQSLNADIIGSYEDHNFGSDIQAANFPNVPLKRYIHDWPVQDLSDVVVIAHPPCSAFSVQNTVKTARGADSNAFACTKRVLDYSMKNGAQAVAIESVPGALSGAWNVHQQYADSYGYHLYRILQNGVAFSAQWRERFWAVFIKKNTAPEKWSITLQPNFQTVSQVVSGYEDGPAPRQHDKWLQRQMDKLQPSLTEGEMSFLFDEQDPPHKTTSLGNVLWHMKFKKPDSTIDDRMDMWKTHVGGFASGVLVYLHPDSYCPVLMAGSHWYYKGRNLSERGYRRLMGFPADYIFPETTSRNFRTMQNMFLSKGVIPQVAAWVLEQVGDHLGLRKAVSTSPANAYVLVGEPNQVIDFRITNKQAWFERQKLMPSLRDDEELTERLYDEAQGEEMTSTVRATLELAKQAIELGTNKDEAREAIEYLLDPPPPEPIPHRKATVKRVAGEKSTAPRRSTKGSVLLKPASLDGLLKKRRRVVELLLERPTMTLDDAVQLCIEHSEINVKYATARWHVTQLIASGHIQEVQA